MYAFTVNYLARDGGRRRTGHLLHRGLFLHGVPWTLLRCRLLGHIPTVDGTNGLSTVDPGHRWVCCNRCGLRGNPQGSLDPAVHAIGDRYLGVWRADPPPDPNTSTGFAALKDLGRGFYPPGPIGHGGKGDEPAGELGLEVCVGNTYGGVGWEWKIGNAGSEHVLAAGLYLGFASLHAHTGGSIGRATQRRLNPTGYDSRITGVRIDRGTLMWRLWSKRDSSYSPRPDREEPRWRHWEWQPRPLDRLFGRSLYRYTDVGDRVPRMVRLPEGDYLVNLQLQRCVHGRDRWSRRTVSWSVDWTAAGPGLPTRGPGRGRIFGSGVKVPDRSVPAGTWPAEAVAAIAARITKDRTGEGWDPVGTVPVEAAT